MFLMMVSELYYSREKVADFQLFCSIIIYYKTYDPQKVLIWDLFISMY